MNLQKSIQSFRNGGVLAIPTDTVYGLACLASIPTAIQKINHIKQRDEQKNYVLQVATASEAQRLIHPQQLEMLIKVSSYWPGEITFVFNKAPQLSYSFLGTTVAIRIPNHPTTLSLLRGLKEPLVVTSLNRSGNPPILSANDIPKDVLDELDGVIRCNQPLSNVPSTIIDLNQSPPQILRKGKIEFDFSLSL